MHSHQVTNLERTTPGSLHRFPTNR